MIIEAQGKTFHTVRASDVERDGMALELYRGSELVGEVFYSDATGELTASLFARDLPLAVLEQFMAEARRGLVPMAE